MDTYDKLFTPRQLVALGTFSDLVGEARESVRNDALASRIPEERATHYADVVATYLAFGVDKAADRNTTLCSWETRMDRMRNTFGRQALPMVWDFAETNPFAGAGGDILGTIRSLCEVLDVINPRVPGHARKQDATSPTNGLNRPVISSDPPYFDNIGYADLSDFFYIWLRLSLSGIYPEIFGTMLVPKSAALVATPYRFGGSKQKAQEFFESGLGEAFARMCEQANPDYPVTLYYAFKQAESEKPSVNGSGVDDDFAYNALSQSWERIIQLSQQEEDGALF